MAINNQPDKLHRALTTQQVRVEHIDARHALLMSPSQAQRNIVVDFSFVAAVRYRRSI